MKGGLQKQLILMMWFEYVAKMFGGRLRPEEYFHSWTKICLAKRQGSAPEPKLSTAVAT